MSIASFSTTGPAFHNTSSSAGRKGLLAEPSEKAAARSPAQSGKRAEDTGAGCRAKAAADLARARAPGGDYMRERLERSAAVWAERAGLLERLEENFKRRTLPA